MTWIMLLLLLGACDTVVAPQQADQAVHEVVREGVLHRAEAGATLVDDRHGALRIADDGPGTGVFVETAPYRRGDFVFEPVTLSPGGVFAAEVVGETAGRTQTLARVLHTFEAPRRQRLAVDLSGMGAEALTAEFYFRGELVHRSEPLRSRGDGLIGIGTTLDEPTSFHYMRVEINGEVITIIEVDYEDEAMEGGLGMADIKPEFEGPAVITSTHVRLIPLAAAPHQVSGVRLSGTHRGDIALVKERFE